METDEDATSTVNLTAADVGDAVMWQEPRSATEDGEFEFNFKWGAVMKKCNLAEGECVEVHELVQNDDTKMWAFSNEYWTKVPPELIQQLQCVDGDDGNAPRAWDALGFRMIDGGTLVKHSDELGSHLFPVGDAAFEVRSESDDSVGSLRDFVVPDNECEPFTTATGDFARDTHACVRAFDNWQPKNEQEAQAKAFIVRQEKRAMQIDDNARFARGMTALSYNQPNDQ